MRYNERARRFGENRRVFSSALKSNPLLATAAGATAVAGGCVSITGALVLLVLMLALLPAVAVISAVERERINVIARPFVYCIFTTLAVFGISVLLDSVLFYDSVTALGIYAPLLAFDGLVLSRTAEDAPILSPREAALESMGVLVCFAAVALPVSLIRELFGSGSLFGLKLGFAGASALRKPFAGFILCGFAVAIYRVVVSKTSNGRGAAQ